MTVPKNMNGRLAQKGISDLLQSFAVPFCYLSSCDFKSRVAYVEKNLVLASYILFTAYVIKPTKMKTTG